MRQLLTFLLCLLCLPLSAATWFLNVNKTGTSLNTGTSWDNAYTNVQYISDTNALVQPDDVVEVAGGTYMGYYWTRSGWTSTTNTWGLPSGTYGHPVTIKKSQTPPYNGQATFHLYAMMWPYTVIDGSMVTSYETNLTTPWLVDLITNNVGFYFDNSFQWGSPWPTNQWNINLEGEGGTYSIKWCVFQPALGYSYDPTFEGKGIASSTLKYLTNIEIAYCWFTNYGASWSIYLNQNQNTPVSFGQWSVHHCLFERWQQGYRIDHPEDLFGGGEWISAGWGLDFYWNICGRYPVIPFEDDGFQIGCWWRMWGNILYPRGSSLMQSELGSTNYDHMYFYRNIITYHPGSSAYGIDTHGGLMQINGWEGSDAAYGHNVWMKDVKLFNNTIICLTTNGPAGFMSFLSRDYLNGQVIRPEENGILIYNNLIYSTNLAGISLAPYSYPYSLYSNGLSYTPAEVKVDYNVLGSISYNTNGTLPGVFNTSDFNTWSGFTHNTATMPTLRGLYSQDYRPVSTDTVISRQGINLTVYATNMPGLLTDLSGVTLPASGPWTIGAYEAAGLLVWLQFTNDFTTGTVNDSSGNTNHGIRYSATNWPYATNGPRTGIAGAHWSNRRPHPVIYDLGDYIAITNQGSGLFYPMTNGTAAVWAYANSNSVGNSYLIGADGTGQGVETNVWAIYRDGEMFRFRVSRWNVDHMTHYIILTFPDDTIGHGSGAEAFTMTNWAHFAVTWDCVADTAIAYYNGSPVQTNMLSVPYLQCNTNMEFGDIPWISIGCNTHDGTPVVDDLDGGSVGYPNNGFFAGHMADVRIYNRALTPTEVLDVFNYTGGSTPPTPPAPGRVIINDVFVDTLRIY